MRDRAQSPPAPVRDPKPRADGRCVHCLKPRKLTKEARRYAGHQLDADPFCSRACVEAWHGIGGAGAGPTDEDER